MIGMQIIAPRIVENGQPVESKTHINIIVDGDTFDKKDYLKEEGYVFDGFFKNWTKIVTREWFKENGFSEVRKIATELKTKPQISGTEAQEAVATMNK